MARKPLRGSPHTEAAYRGHPVAISVQLAGGLGTEAGKLHLGKVPQCFRGVRSRLLTWAFVRYDPSRRPIHHVVDRSASRHSLTQTANTIVVEIVVSPRVGANDVALERTWWTDVKPRRRSHERG